MVLRKSLILTSVLALNACAGNNTFLYNPPPQGMEFSEMNYYKWDCGHPEEQYAYLKSQLDTLTPFPFDDARRAIIYKNMNEIRTACPPPAPKPAGCVNVREDFAKGSGQASVCNLGRLRPLERPVVNKWEAIVDQK
jgi:hypothetical protein